jgi:2-oxoglutarate dehydrogenase complex dehydrogenase (E1) component-like enzyme
MPPHEPEEASSIERALESVNAGYVAELYAQYRRDPTSVDPEWRTLFESGAGGFEPAPPSAPPSGGNGQADARPIPAGATPI